MKCIFIRWNPEKSDFKIEDLEKSINHDTSITSWSIPDKFDPKVGDACIVSQSNVDDGGYLAICGFITSIKSSNNGKCTVQVNGYFTDLDCYPLFYDSSFSNLTKKMDFIEGPEVELMPEEIVPAFHIIILRELARQDILYLDQSEDMFDDEMKNILRAIQDIRNY